MRTGTLDGIVHGGEFQKVYDSGELGAAATSITISGLDGNNEVEYALIVRSVNGYNGVASYACRFNNDSGANYGYQRIYGIGSTIGASRAAGETSVFLGRADALSQLAFIQSIMHIKSGYVRTLTTDTIMAITGTTITYQHNRGEVWNNTADNITSLVIFADQANGIGVGSRVILLRRNAQAVGQRTGTLDVQGKLKGAFQKIYQTTLVAAATSVTISGLDGNTDIIYKAIIRQVSGATNTLFIRPNNDANQANYGFQYIEGNNSGAYALALANNATYNLGMRCSSTTVAANQLLLAEALLYAKSGYLRTSIIKATGAIATTTVEDVNVIGNVWTNTADNITSLVIAGSAADSLGIGSTIELYAYREQ